MTLAERLRVRWAETADVPPVYRGEDMPDARTVPAAVLAAIVDRPQPTLLLTRRDDNLRRHAGQVAFAGGRADPDDRGPVDTALREAWEEIALPPAAVDVIGCDTPFRIGTGFEVVPVVAVIPPDLPLRPLAIEVADIFEVPLAFLLDPLNRVEREGMLGGQVRRYVEYLHDRFRIWGATAAMIVNLARRIGDG